MPYGNPEQQREYMRQWIAHRRTEWFKDKVCEFCGSTENLELDHIDPATKITHSIWSWSSERRDAELAKCRPLCRECHKKKSADEHAKGSVNGNAKLTENEILAIRQSREPTRILSVRYNVNMRTIQHVRKGDTWKHMGH